MENRNQTVQKMRPGYKFGRRVGTMFVVLAFATALAFFSLLTMAVIKLILLGMGFIVSQVLGVPIDSPLVAIIAVPVVLYMLYKVSIGFDK